MGEVNGRRERWLSESNFRPAHASGGEQPAAKNGRIPGLFRADQQTERLSTWAMLAERAGFEPSVQIWDAEDKRCALEFSRNFFITGADSPRGLYCATGTADLTMMTAHSNRTRANPVNAKKSTGPRSELGRRRASLNRLLHGLRGSTPVLPGEDPNELDELMRKVTKDTQPRGVIEEFMAERVAMGIWRLRRAERAELGVFANHLLTIEAKRADRDRGRCEFDVLEQLAARNATITDEAGHLAATAQLGAIEAAAEEDLPTLGQALAQEASGSATIDLAMRYKTATERSLFRTLHELRDLQDARTRS